MGFAPTRQHVQKWIVPIGPITIAPSRRQLKPREVAAPAKAVRSPGLRISSSSRNRIAHPHVLLWHSDSSQPSNKSAVNSEASSRRRYEHPVTVTSLWFGPIPGDAPCLRSNSDADRTATSAAGALDRRGIGE